MRRQAKKFTIISLLLLLASPAFAAFISFGVNGAGGGVGGDPTVGVLPSYNDAYANWAVAGLTSIGGIPSRTTQCGSTINPSGITTPGGSDDASVINAAIAAANPLSCNYIQLAAGTFNIFGTGAANTAETINLNKAITLRGTGSCTNGSSPYCSTVIRQYDGVLQTYSDTPVCGASLPGSACPNWGATILLGNTDTAWSGCDPNVNDTGCSTALSSNAAQGDTLIHVASTSNLSVGMWARVDEAAGASIIADPSSPSGEHIYADPNFATTSGSPAVGKVVYTGEPGSVEPGYGSNYDRVNSEIHKISTIGAGTVTFDSPLTIAFRTSHNAQIYWPTRGNGTAQAFVQQAGLENMSILRTAHSPAIIQQCAYCWVRGVETAGWSFGLNIINSARVELSNNYLHDTWNAQNNGAEYPFGLDGGTTEALITNNISIRGGKGMVARSAGGGNVVSYNYVDETFYQADNGNPGNFWVDMGVNGSHYVGAHHILFEGNWGENCDNDETHGNETYHTFFRNDCTGLRSPFNDPSLTTSTSVTFNAAPAVVDDANSLSYLSGSAWPYSNQPLRGGGSARFDYWMAFVGNVLGTAGVSRATNQWGFLNTGADSNIWQLGGNDGGCGDCSDPNLNGTNTPQFIFQHGNWDYSNFGVTWQSGFANHTLPNSFYLAGAPAFFATGSGYPWPWVTPTDSVPLQPGPATGASCPGVTYDATDSASVSVGSLAANATFAWTLPHSIPVGSDVVFTVTGSLGNGSAPSAASMLDNASGVYNSYAQTSMVFGSPPKFIQQSVGFNSQGTPSQVTLYANRVTGGLSGVRLTMDVFNGLNTIDNSNAQYQAAAGTGANAVTTGALPVSYSGDLIVGAAFSPSASSTAVHGTGFTIAQSNPGSSGVYTEYNASGGSAGSSNPATFTDATHGGSPFVTAGVALRCNTPAYSPLPAKARYDAGTPFVQP